ncbi:hypothetical protein J6590_015898 [Homalodisca vitripennis]|nr:hypothetical protein J6590_015898 [Homalodisca vitripennis]
MSIIVSPRGKVINNFCLVEAFKNFNLSTFVLPNYWGKLFKAAIPTAAVIIDLTSGEPKEAVAGSGRTSAAPDGHKGTEADRACDTCPCGFHMERAFRSPLPASAPLHYLWGPTPLLAYKRCKFIYTNVSHASSKQSGLL